MGAAVKQQASVVTTAAWLAWNLSSSLYIADATQLPTGTPADGCNDQRGESHLPVWGPGSEGLGGRISA